MNEHHEKSWKYPLSVTDVPQDGLDVELVADEDVRRQLASENGLVSLGALSARLHVARRGKGGLRVEGEVRARVNQTCVVTLEPFESDIVEPVDVEFEPEREKPAPEPRKPESRKPERRTRHKAPEPVLEDETGMDDLDAPDTIVDGRIDLGALASEFLALGIDPYPRKPGAAFEEPKAGPERVSPFAGLAALADKPGTKG